MLHIICSHLRRIGRGESIGLWIGRARVADQYSKWTVDIVDSHESIYNIFYIYDYYRHIKPRF